MPKTTLSQPGALLDHLRPKERSPHATDASFGEPNKQDDSPAATKPSIPLVLPKEIGGPAGPEPTRFGDWERKGRVSDF